MWNIFEWMKSTRSVIAIMAMVLLFVVVIGTMIGYVLPDGVNSLVSMTVGGVITAYFGKRDTIEDRLPDNSTISTKTEVTTEGNTGGDV